MIQIMIRVGDSYHAKHYFKLHFQPRGLFQKSVHDLNQMRP